MTSTILLVSLFLILLAVEFVLRVVFLRWGLRWAKVEGATWGRVALATLLAVVLQVPIAIGQRLLSPASVAQAALFGLGGLLASVVVAWSVIAVVCKARLLRAAQAWLLTLIPSLGTVVVVLLLVIPYLAEAFKIPTNSMAPTILGKHWRGVCARCGGPAFGSPFPGPPVATGYSPRMICEQGFHVSEVKDFDPRVRGGDRILVAKFLKPRRWDLIVFRYPEDPSEFYTKRLVGLPGEEIIIDKGAVWADGKQLTLPDSLRRIEYLSEMPGAYVELWGTRARPAKLGPDEYFVLGDFSAQAKDSRLWEQGAPGHPPYAVPRSYLHGVVTHIYWPPQRCRTLR